MKWFRRTGPPVSIPLGPVTMADLELDPDDSLPTVEEPDAALHQLEDNDPQDISQKRRYSSMLWFSTEGAPSSPYAGAELDIAREEMSAWLCGMRFDPLLAGSRPGAFFPSEKQRRNTAGAVRLDTMLRENQCADHAGSHGHSKASRKTLP